MNYKNKDNKNELLQFKNEVLKNLSDYIEICINSEDDKKYKKSALISYWLNDFHNYIEREETFKPYKLKRYERGDVIKVNLGFNIGSEYGGLHYAIVLDKANAVNSDVINIIPLSSKKNNKEIHPNDVFLGTDIYEQLQNKYHHTENIVKENTEKIIQIHSIINTLQETQTDSSDAMSIVLHNAIKQVENATILLKEFDKLKKEINKMKKGSIALVSQITTISKLRIFNPKRHQDTLSGIKISPASLDLISEKLSDLFIGK